MNTFGCGLGYGTECSNPHFFSQVLPLCNLIGRTNAEAALFAHLGEEALKLKSLELGEELEKCLLRKSPNLSVSGASPHPLVTVNLPSPSVIVQPPQLSIAIHHPEMGRSESSSLTCPLCFGDYTPSATRQRKMAEGTARPPNMCIPCMHARSPSGQSRYGQGHAVNPAAAPSREAPPSQLNPQAETHNPASLQQVSAVRSNSVAAATAGPLRGASQWLPTKAEINPSATAVATCPLGEAPPRSMRLNPLAVILHNHSAASGGDVNRAAHKPTPAEQSKQAKIANAARVAQVAAEKARAVTKKEIDESKAMEESCLLTKSEGLPPLAASVNRNKTSSHSTKHQRVQRQADRPQQIAAQKQLLVKPQAAEDMSVWVRTANAKAEDSEVSEEKAGDDELRRLDEAKRKKAHIKMLARSLIDERTSMVFGLARINDPDFEFEADHLNMQGQLVIIEYGARGDFTEDEESGLFKIRNVFGEIYRCSPHLLQGVVMSRDFDSNDDFYEEYVISQFLEYDTKDCLTLLHNQSSEDKLDRRMEGYMQRLEHL